MKFLIGRYNKYSRNISQTPWLIKDSDPSTYPLTSIQVLFTNIKINVEGNNRKSYLSCFSI